MFCRTQLKPMRILGPPCRPALCALTLAFASPLGAGGIDVSGQSAAFLHADGTVVELSFGRSVADVTGAAATFLGGGDIDNVAKPLGFGGFSIKTDISDRVSLGVIYDTPFKADLVFPTGNIAFGGTRAQADTSSLTGLVRYKASDRLSFFGGLRRQTTEASFKLSGALYGPVSGYQADLNQDSALGYVAGVSFEIPEAFLRATLTYNSEIEHSFATTETLGQLVQPSTVTATTPQSVNLDVISGIAPDTFAFGSARWVEWSKLQIAPQILSSFSSDPLVEFRDTVTYSLGVGRRFAPEWVGTVAAIYEPSTGADTTPLNPTDGFHGVSFGVRYEQGKTSIQGSATFLRFGDTEPFVDALGTSVADYEDNTSVAFGLTLTQRF